MTINNRIKSFRKERKLNQRQFAELLGVTQSGVSYMEQDGSTISESSVKIICSIFNLNENWLRNGIEPMYIHPPTFSLDKFVKEHGADEIELSIIKTYFEIDANVRHKIIELFKNELYKSAQKNTVSDSNANDIPDIAEELEIQFPSVDTGKKESGTG